MSLYFARHFQSPTVPFKQLTTPAPKYSETWVNEALITQQNVWREINENLNKTADNQKAQHNKHANERTFQAGDLVCIIEDKPKIGKNIKLLKRWTGPYMLTRMISDTHPTKTHRKRGDCSCPTINKQLFRYQRIIQKESHHKQLECGRDYRRWTGTRTTSSHRNQHTCNPRGDGRRDGRDTNSETRSFRDTGFNRSCAHRLLKTK